MRTRIAIALVLALGVLTVAAPVSAQISDSGKAAEVQYPDAAPKAAAETAAPSATPAETSDDNDLPFTGFVAVPLLVTGLVLLVAGGVLNRRTRERDN